MKIKKNILLDNKLKTICQVDLYLTFCLILVLFLIKVEMPWVLKQIGLTSFYYIFVNLSKNDLYLILFAFVIAINVCLLVYMLIKIVLNVVQTLRIKK